MEDRDRHIQRCLNRDADDWPLDRLNERGLDRRDRLGSALEIMLDGGGAMLFLHELFASKARQVGGHVCLWSTFLQSVDFYGDEIIDAMPDETGRAFRRLVEMVREGPLRLHDPHMLAHSLIIPDSHLKRWLTQPERENYETLGLSPEASEEDVKQAYRDLAKKYHPDHGGDAERFHEIQHAHDAIIEGATQ